MIVYLIISVIDYAAVIVPSLRKALAGLDPMVATAIVLGFIGLCAMGGWVPSVVGVVAGSWLNASGYGQDVAVLGGLVAGVVTYLLRCWSRPRTPCWWCKGKSKFFNSEGHFRLCWLCGGGGQRRRVGAKVWRRHRPSG